MGIDLRLLPCECWREEDGKVWGFSHTILELGRVGGDAFDDYEELVKPHLVELPDGHDVSSYVGERVTEGYYKGEPTYGTLGKDAYGTPCATVTAKQLLPWLEEHFCHDDRRGGPYRTSIVAFVRALPPDTKIVLDWH